MSSQLITLLKADAAVTTLIASGSPLEYRLDPDFASGEENPRLVYQLRSSGYVNGHDGKAAVNSSIQISCWADTRSGADALADAVETAIDGTGYITGRRDDRDPDTRDYRTLLFWSYWS